ncbi:hypothetical protein A210_09320 [Pseudomonas putida SJTE-1]|uniref:Lipoprotein n=1 Tax=Pseudomonas putida ND6 TaxID=231023 RepID=I3V1E1_PSEPU|nr:lipoprotein [Pseudomonas putida ND6]ANI02811.1 hypothetical protein A210_09320 [Pseudomonas putida SJTE-1]
MGVEYIIDEKLFAGLPAKENRRRGVNVARTKAQRADIQIPAADPQADGWQQRRSDKRSNGGSSASARQIDT